MMLSKSIVQGGTASHIRCSAVVMRGGNCHMVHRDMVEGHVAPPVDRSIYLYEYFGVLEATVSKVIGVCIKKAADNFVPAGYRI